MASGPYFIVFLCLTSGLWMGANAQMEQIDDECCKRCPSGWTQFDDNCYMFHFNGEDWADAEVSCIAIGGNLASILDKDQYDFLKTLIKTVTGADTRVWVGGHDAVEEGVWLWSDGSKFDLKIWGPGEPNNNLGTENCLEMNYSGLPNDLQCTEKKPYICGRRL